LHTVALSFLLIFTVRISRAAITKVEFDAKGFAGRITKTAGLLMKHSVSLNCELMTLVGLLQSESCNVDIRMITAVKGENA
jgi:predicted secreted protein